MARTGAVFAQAPLPRLTELRLATLGDRIEAGLVACHGDLVAELESLVAEHPLHERFAGLLMRALAQSGRTGDALAVYARLRDAPTRPPTSPRCTSRSCRATRHVRCGSRPR
jgi:DNA-binding SARP family transcriptional activator